MGKPRIIVCAAIRNLVDQSTIVYGPRHSHCFKLAPKGAAWEQGFADQDGVFISRKEAWKIADEAGQLRCPTGLETDYSHHRKANFGDEGILFSENLY